MRAVEGFFFLALLAFLLCLSASGSFAKAVNSSEKTYSEEPVVSLVRLLVQSGPEVLAGLAWCLIGLFWTNWRVIGFSFRSTM